MHVLDEAETMRTDGGTSDQEAHEGRKLAPPKREHHQPSRAKTTSRSWRKW
jgi:hypothetical protein